MSVRAASVTGNAGAMLVTGRDPHGSVQLWRVGRRRIAWRPRSAITGLAHDDPMMFSPLPGRLVGQALEWIPALLATVAVWPWRSCTGSWPVVAYTLGMADQAGYLYLETVGGRAAADTLALQWVADIGRHGRPQGVEPVEVVADRTDLTGL